MPWNLLDPMEAAAPPGTHFGQPLMFRDKTLAAMREELRLALGGRGDVGSARLDGWLNDAYVDLCSSLKLDEMKGSVSVVLEPGQHLYRLPEVVETILGAAIVVAGQIREGWPLEKIDLMAYRALKDAVGEPTTFFRLGEMVVLWPTPVEARELAIDFRVQPIPLREDEHSPALPRLWHEGIVLSARQKAFSGLLEFDKSVIAGNEFVDFVRRKRDREAVEDENRIVGSSRPRRTRELRNRTVGHSPWED